MFPGAAPIGLVPFGKYKDGETRPPLLLDVQRRVKWGIFCRVEMETEHPGDFRDKEKAKDVDEQPVMGLLAAPLKMGVNTDDGSVSRANIPGQERLSVFVIRCDPTDKGEIASSACYRLVGDRMNAWHMGAAQPLLSCVYSHSRRGHTV